LDSKKTRLQLVIHPTGTIHSNTVTLWRYYDSEKFIHHFSNYNYLPQGKYKRQLAREILRRFNWKFMNEITFETTCPRIVIEILKILLIKGFSLDKETFQRCKEASLKKILEELKPLAVSYRMK